MATVHMSAEIETAVNSYMKSDDNVESNSAVAKCVKGVY